MCGIAAILVNDEGRKFEFLNRSIDLLRHRGPNGNGSWQGINIGLAHTRLAILDLSEAGVQPMRSESGRYQITYNGEIYNHLHLRAKHFPGRRWRGHSDTETILSLFEKLGIKIFDELIGMWALAIWDTWTKKLLISRDRYGQKPLYYRFYLDGSFALASEIKPLLLPEKSNPANPLMAAEYLALGNYGHLGEQTFFADINQLLPGHFAWVQLGDQRLSPEAYWQLPIIPRRDKIPVGSAEITKLGTLLVDAVQSQTISDVPIGATLSGGLDSSLVNGILATNASSEQPLNVFTAQTPGSKWDESSYVKAVTDKWGGRIRLYSKDMNQASISETLEKTIWIQEEPFGDPSIIAHGFLMDMAKEVGVKVVLGGQGADEVFRGYPHSIQQLFSHELSHFNVNYVWSEIQRNQLIRSNLGHILLGSYSPRLERILRRRSREKRRFFLSPAMQEAAKAAEKQNDIPLSNDWEGAMRESIMAIHIPHLVHYDDRNGMARSIEGRMPFLDHRLLDLTSTFEPSSFYVDGLSKYLIRAAGRQFLPAEVFERKDKIGFYTPLSDMLCQDSEWVQNILIGVNWMNNNIRKKYVNSLRQHSLSPDIALQIWRIISFDLWKQQFNMSM